MNAPFCPVTREQKHLPTGLPTKLPSIPLATDLPSLIRAVNIMRDILRTLTTSLTVNNTFYGTSRPSRQYGSKEYLMSRYRADWYQVGRDEENGFVYYKAKGKEPDKEQRAYVIRMHRVELRNVNIDNDQSFYWNYYKALEGEEDDRMSFPFEEDFFERIINVHWGTPGAFGFAGGIVLDEVTPPTPNSIGQSTPHFTWLGGTSRKGEVWKSSKKEEKIYLFCCVGGKVGSQFITVAAGNIIDGPYDFGPGYSKNYGAVPAGGVSTDEGQTWKDAKVPLQEHILYPPDPTTGAAAGSAQGACNAVAYHPATQTFYLGAQIIFVDGKDVYWEERMYKGSGSNFSEVYSERRELADPFTGYRWPAVAVNKPNDRLRVADMTRTTPPGPGVIFVTSFGPGQRAEYVTTQDVKSYVAVTADGKGITVGTTKRSPPIDSVNSVCGGAKHIVVVGNQDNDTRTGPVTYVSKDDGVSWTQQLTELVNENPKPEDKDGGNSSGSCSYSLRT